MKILIVCFLISFNSFAKFDHTHIRWDNILSKYTKIVGKQTLVNYQSLKRNMGELNLYLKELENLGQHEFDTFTKKEKLSFWINAYNAYTFQIILKNYPIKSIKEIKSGFFSSGPWGKEFIKLFGKKISLDFIEHKTIRKNFHEPRIHFAVNCASIGCPSLLTSAFTATKLEQQLQQAALNFVSNQTKNSLKGKTLYLSKIFKWYGDDFKQKYGGYQKFVIKTLRLPNKVYPVEFNEYNWSLNQVSY
jgi:hypothetical protein